MRKVRWVALCAAVVAGLAGTSAVAGAQSTSKEKPEATEVGITPTEIHIAVIADVDNSFAPGLFKASIDGVQGVAKYINATGGLAGRKLVVDFYDSHVNPTQTRQAEIQACQNDVAMVGTSAALLNTIEEMRDCKDSAGAVTGLPDIPFYTGSIDHQCSSESFPIAPSALVCSTKDEHPQTYQANVGRGRYYQKKYGKDLHGIYVFGNDSQAARDATFASVAALRDIGIKSDSDFDRSARATQSEYTEIVQAMKTDGSNYGQCTSSFPCTVLLRKEAALQGLTGVKVWDCGSACYDQQFLASGGQDVEGQYVDTTFLPFLSKADQKANKMAANFVKYTGATKAASYGAYTWAAGIAFRDAVNAIVKRDGVNGITRKTILAELAKVHAFDAEGMIGTIDLAGRKVSACDVTLQVKNGEFVRVNPTKPGTYSCSPKNVISRELDLIKG
jgi:ABC-type branched-subunit amino acid transport system substrate-binding protein